MKFTILFSFVIFPFVLLLQGGQDINQQFESGTLEIALRKVGHDILLQSGDSTSRVLPIEKIDDHTYYIRFGKNFSFKPDSLVGNIGQTLADYGIDQSFLVNVMSCSKNEVIYGFSVFERPTISIGNLDTISRVATPCLGREYANQCYYIKLVFEKGSKANYLMLGVPFLLLFIPLLLWLYKRNDTQKQEKESKLESTHTIGKYIFLPNKNELILNGEVTVLTFKESKLLEILAAAPNVVVSREDLQKLVWEDEGVIVGRSLDVFISKLRKKLEQDDHVSILSEHGKGYVLRIND